MKNFNKYPGFDEDKSSIGAAILWNINECDKFKAVELEISGTEELTPTVHDTTPRKKKDPSRWIRSVKRFKVNTVQGFFHTKKTGVNKGKEVVVKKKEMKEGCSDKCRFQCSRHNNKHF